jgi:hypothetical protein
MPTKAHCQEKTKRIREEDESEEDRRTDRPKGRDGAKSKTARLVRTGRQTNSFVGGQTNTAKTIGQDSRSKESPPLGKKKKERQ